MTAIDRYLKEVKSRVFGTSNNIQRFEDDLRARYEQGLAEGESPAAVIERLGAPDEVASAFMADVEFEYAGFFERVFAFVADLGVCVALCVPFLMLGVLLGPWAEQVEAPWRLLVIFSMVTVFVSLMGVFVFYFPLLESHFGRTPGKFVMKIQVRTEEGARIGLGAAFLRRLSLFFEILVLDSLFVPFTEKKQRAFDIVARTIVVKDPDGKRSALRYPLCLALLALPLVSIGAFVVLFGAS